MGKCRRPNSPKCQLSVTHSRVFVVFSRILCGFNSLTGSRGSNMRIRRGQIIAPEIQGKNYFWAKWCMEGWFINIYSIFWEFVVQNLIIRPGIIRGGYWIWLLQKFHFHSIRKKTSRKWFYYYRFEIKYKTTRKLEDWNLHD